MSAPAVAILQPRTGPPRPSSTEGGPWKPDEPASSPSAGRAHDAPDAPPAKKSILLVEDDLDTREVYRAALMYGGYSVSVASDGRDAIRIAREEQPDLILMDLNLPILDGWRATTQIKADAATRGIPVIAVSAELASENRERASKRGFEDYFEKPITPRALLESVQRFFDDLEAS